MIPVDANLILEGAVRASRCAAVVTGVLVVIDSIGVMIDHSPRPPRPRISALAWAIAGVVVAGTGIFLIGQRAILAADIGREYAQVVAILFWGGLAIAFTTRALARAQRPWLTGLSFVLMMGFGTALAVLCPL
jgi:hypothetical protein